MTLASFLPVVGNLKPDAIRIGKENGPIIGRIARVHIRVARIDALD